MISAKDRDMNRSRDVKGPELKRPYEEKTMKDSMQDSAPTGTLEKCPLADLHQGDHEVPLTALGMQEVVVKATMGQDSPDHVPVTSKGPTKDQSHHGEKKSGSYSEKSKSE